jgi:hypothetical protein|tara:strand:- start:25 stop:516 length:492 start_codon:yes stop_codon:yes gene_type:complete
MVQQDNKLRYLVIGNAMAVLLIGLLSGIMLIFSLLDAVTLWPFPEWKVIIPGSTRGWQAAHVGGILNGVMIAGAAYLMQTLELTGRREKWAGWGMIITGWANTVFYWGGNFAANRGLSVATTPYGEGDLAGALAFLGGGAGMVFTFIAVSIFALAAFEKAKAS